MNRRSFLSALAISAYAKPPAPRVNGPRLRQHLEGLSVFGRPAEGSFSDGVSRLADDHRRARRLAEGLARIPGLSIDLATVQTNIVRFDVACLGYTSGSFAEALKRRGVSVSGGAAPGLLRKTIPRCGRRGRAHPMKFAAGKSRHRQLSQPRHYAEIAPAAARSGRDSGPR